MNDGCSRRHCGQGGVHLQADGRHDSKFERAVGHPNVSGHGWADLSAASDEVGYVAIGWSALPTSVVKIDWMCSDTRGGSKMRSMRRSPLVGPISSATSGSGWTRRQTSCNPIVSMLAISVPLALWMLTDLETGTFVKKCDRLSQGGCKIEFMSPKRTARVPANLRLSCLRNVQSFCCLAGSLGKCTTKTNHY